MEITQGADVREALRQMGATDAQLKAKVVDFIEESMLSDEEVRSETVKSELRKMWSDQHNLHNKQSAISRDISGLERRANAVDKRVAEYEKKLELADKAISEHVIEDVAVKDGLLAYKSILESTKSVFGEEKMTEAVICRAIEAASYGMWRSVMGPKDPKDGNKSGRRL